MAVSSSECIVSNGKDAEESGRRLSRSLQGGTEENNEIPQLGQAVSEPNQDWSTASLG
jgi:hypothetical protein